MSAAPPFEKTAYRPAPGGDGNPAKRGGARRANPAGWFFLATMLAVAIGYGFFVQPPRADPFADAAPLISLDWWLHPLPHRALMAVEEVPIGNRGAFVPRSGV